MHMHACVRVCVCCGQAHNGQHKTNICIFSLLYDTLSAPQYALWVSMILAYILFFFWIFFSLTARMSPLVQYVSFLFCGKYFLWIFLFFF